MNPEKSEMKMVVLQTHGEKVENRLEQCRLENTATEAALQVLIVLNKEFQKYVGEIEIETRTGQLSPAHAVVARKYVKRCVDLAENFFKGAEMKLHSTRGKIDAFNEVVSSLKADLDAEKKKLDGFKEAQIRALDELAAIATANANVVLVPVVSPAASVSLDQEVSIDVDTSDLESKPRKSRPIRMDVARSLGIDKKRR